MIIIITIIIIKYICNFCQITTVQKQFPRHALNKMVSKKTRCKFALERPCRKVISIIKIRLRNGYSPASSFHMFRTLFDKDNSAELLVRFTLRILRASNFTVKV